MSYKGKNSVVCYMGTSTVVVEVLQSTTDRTSPTSTTTHYDGTSTLKPFSTHTCLSTHTSPSSVHRRDLVVSVRPRLTALLIPVVYNIKRVLTKTDKRVV